MATLRKVYNLQNCKEIYITSKDVAYLCDADRAINDTACRATYCYKNGGECKHTLDVSYAKNFNDIGDNHWFEKESE